MKIVVATLIAAALLVTYIALTVSTPQPPPQLTSPAQPESTQQTPQTTQTQTPAQEQQVKITHTTTPPEPTTTPPRQPASKEEEKSTAPAETPKLRMWINATDVTTTELPICINYTVYVKNEGRSPAEVKIGNYTVMLKSGEVYTYTKKLRVDRAGVYIIKEQLDGLTAAAEIKVLYYAPRLEALPVEIEVDKVPTEVVVNVTIVNKGNYTGKIGQLEVPPGAEVKIPMRLLVKAAGMYMYTVGETPVQVSVKYRYAKVLIEAPIREFEIFPGEAIEVPIRLHNIGNATAAVQIGNERIEVPPGGQQEVTYRLKPPAAGTYRIEVKTGELVYHVDVIITTISYRVQIAVISPFTKAGYMDTPYKKDSEEVASDSVEITWRPTIYTNATRRIVAFDVDGRIVKVEPGKPADLEVRRLSAKVPSTVQLSVSINGTRYTFELELKRRPPVLEIAYVDSITYTDERPVETRISCRGLGDRNVYILQVKAQIDFRRGMLSGEVRVRIAGDEFTFTYRGTFSAGKGQAEISGVPLINKIYVEFETDPPRIVSVKDKDNNPIPCTFPAEILPTVLKKPSGSGRIDLIVQTLLNSFAKGLTDRVTRVEIEGERRVKARDIGGRDYVVEIREDVVEISGQLEARLYGRFRILH